MSTFSEMGYLSQRVADEVENFSKHFAPWKALYYKLNEYAIKQFFACKPNERSAVDLLLFCCAYRMLTVYQSAYLLIERGNDTEAKTLLRSLVETLFVLASSEKDSEFVRQYIIADDNKRIKLVEDALEVNDALRADVKDTMLTAEQAREMRATVAAYKAKHTSSTPPTQAEKDKAKVDKLAVKIWKIAETAKLTVFYKTHYAFLCMFTHPSPEGMRDYLVLDDNGKITSFKVGQRWNDTEANMRIAMVMLITALGSLATHFKLPIETELKAFENELNSVVAQSHTLRVKGD